jgi:hypothetical protein
VTDADRHVDLWLSDFAEDPYEVANTLPVRPFVVTRKGELQGIRCVPARRNLIIIRHSFTLAGTWSSAIDALMLLLGGWGAAQSLMVRLKPVECMVQFTLPIRTSPHQENNFIEAATLARLIRLKADLGFEFDEHRSAELD